MDELQANKALIDALHEQAAALGEPVRDFSSYLNWS